MDVNFPETCDYEVIGLDNGSTHYDIHTLTMFQDGVVNIEWRDLPYKVFLNSDISPIKKLYDHVSDEIIGVRILQLRDEEGVEYKCIAPYAYLELMEMVGHRLSGSHIFLQKVDPVFINWTYTDSTGSQ